MRHTRLVVSLFLGIALYQNCGNPQRIAADLSTPSTVKTMSETVKDADVAWSMLGERPVLSASGHLQRWNDIRKVGVNLYPPFLPNSQTLNLERSGLLETVGTNEFLRFAESASLAPAVADLSQFVFEDMTVLMVINGIKMPKAPDVIRLFGLYPVNGETGGVLVIDVIPGADATTELIMQSWFDGNTWSVRKITLTNDDLSKPIAIAARFDKQPNEIHIAVNGRLTEKAIESKGTVPPLALVARSLSIHASDGYGGKGEFSLGEFAIYRSGKSDDDLVKSSAALAALWASGAPKAAPAPTAVISTDPGGTPDGATLYKTNCSGCHGELATSNRRGRTAAQIRTALNTSSTMASVTALTDAEVQAIADALK